MRKLIAFSVALLVAGAVSVHAAEAKAIWEKDCAKCHGPDGKGQTMMGKRLKIKDLTEAKVQDAIKDEQIAKDIKDGVKEDGRTRMKAYGDTLSEQEIKDLVKYVRSLKK
jgi:mono/diheme cytochrome c family protein